MYILEKPKITSISFLEMNGLSEIKPKSYLKKSDLLYKMLAQILHIMAS
jgi:hypothetical protein